MPWELDTPVTTGGLDLSGPYDQIMIIRQGHDARRRWITLEMEYGNTLSGVWVPGVANPIGAEVSCVILDDDYSTLINTHTTNDGELTYNAVKRGLYEYLSASGIIPSGTMV